MTRARDLAAGTFELATGGVLKLETSDTTVTDGSVLGKIEFKAPDEASGTDANLTAAAIEAVAEGTFAADNNATELVFKTGASAAADAKMIIDSIGNLLVGTTDTSLYNNTSGSGIMLAASGRIDVARVQDVCSILNRTGSSDGSIINFAKNGSTSGLIGVAGSNIYIGSVDTGLKVDYAANAIHPCNPSSDGSGRDDVVDLGKSNIRFDDIFATNGTIQTSDANEKQDIASLTSAEMLVAKRISALFKTFRWKNKVAAKGNDARTHTGIIAQDVQAAFTAESLDAGDYSLFISSTWWTHDVEVPAVEAKDAYTRTDIYDTEDEAPEGAVKKTRMGIRYPELLSFVAAYNEQRFASIETRLTALEG